MAFILQMPKRKNDRSPSRSPSLDRRRSRSASPLARRRRRSYESERRERRRRGNSPDLDMRIRAILEERKGQDQPGGSQAADPPVAQASQVGANLDQADDEVINYPVALPGSSQSSGHGRPGSRGRGRGRGRSVRVAKATVPVTQGPNVAVWAFCRKHSAPLCSTCMFFNPDFKP